MYPEEEGETVLLLLPVSAVPNVWLPQQAAWGRSGLATVAGALMAS